MLQLMKASAGSGKTYSLARQYIALLLKSNDRYAYRHILAVTFTNKATDEMKNRILKELHIMSTQPSRSGYRDWFIPSLFHDEASMQDKAGKVLQDILHDYSAFAVSTIDRFFQQALKAFSREIGHFASYQVELDKDSLVAESVDRILDSLTEENSGLLSWLTDNVLEQIEQGGRYNMDANLLEMAKRLKSPQRQVAIEQTGVNPETVASKENLIAIRERCRDIRSAFIESLQDKAGKALEVMETAGVHPDESYRKFLSILYDYQTIDEAEGIVPPKDSFFARAKDHEAWFTKTKAKTLLPLVYPFLEAPLQDFCDMWGREYAVYNTAKILDDQLYGQFCKCKDFLRQEPIQAESREHLKSLLEGRQANGIIFTTMQKFEESEGALSERRNIVVMADEAHRGQYGFSEKIVMSKNEQGEEEAHVVVGNARIIRE